MKTKIKGEFIQVSKLKGFVGFVEIDKDGNIHITIPFKNNKDGKEILDKVFNR